MSDGRRPDRNLALDLVRVTETGALKNGFLSPGWSTNALLLRVLRAAR